MKKMIFTAAAAAPIGAYSQAIGVGNTVYVSGQIGIHPATGELISHDPKEQVIQIFKNMREIALAAGGSLNHIVALTVYLIDLQEMTIINQTIAECIEQPWPARTTIQVAKLPRDAAVEISSVLVISSAEATVIS